MAVCRIEKTKNYTVMSNCNLRDKRLSLKAVRLLSVMLSLPEDWDYTTRGLAAICKDGVDAIGAALRELEGCGYLTRRRIRDSKGRMRDTEYVIYESPQMPPPETASPDAEKPYPEDGAERNKDRNKYQKEKITDEQNTDSIPFLSAPPKRADVSPEAKRRETMQKIRDCSGSIITSWRICKPAWRSYPSPAGRFTQKCGHCRKSGASSPKMRSPPCCPAAVA